MSFESPTQASRGSPPHLQCEVSLDYFGELLKFFLIKCQSKLNDLQEGTSATCHKPQPNPNSLLDLHLTP